MKKAILQILIYCLQLNITAQNFEWTRVRNKGYSIGKAVATDKWGNVYVTGHYDTIFLSKYNSAGKLLWAKGPGEGGNAVVVDSTGIYLGGETHIAKYDTAGNLLWARYSAGVYDIATSPDGGFVVLGYIRDSVVLHGSSSSIILRTPPGNDICIYIAKYNTNGEPLWAKSEGAVCTYPCGRDAMLPVNMLSAKSITTDMHDNIFVTGTFLGTVTFDSTSNPATIINNSNYSYIYYAKYDANGHFNWVKHSTGTDEQEPTGIQTDHNGDIYLTGRFASNIVFSGSTLTGGISDMFLVKVNNNGNLIWGKKGGLWAGEGTAIDISLQGNLLVAGNFTKYMNYNGQPNTLVTSNWDSFILNLDLNGNLIWAAKTNNLSGSGMGTTGISSDYNENLFITGWFDGKVTFGDSTYSCSAYRDMFVAKINGNSNASVTEGIDHSIFIISPNPSDGHVFITYKADAEIKDAVLQVKNSLGQIIYSKTYKAFTAEINDMIDLSKHAKGIYFMEIIADRKRTVRKVVVD